MEKDNFFADDITAKKSSPMKIDDFASVKDNTMDFLRNERAEKFDVEKPKLDMDDFLNFHDDVGETRAQPENSPLIPTIERDEKIEDTKSSTQPEPEIDFHAIEDEYLNPYASSALSKGSEAHNEKFISSEDLLTEFKDPIPADVPEVPKPVEAPKPVAVEQPPVAEPVKPVVEPVKPKTAPPPAPVKKPTSDDTQIEAEKIFNRIGLG